jgi:hypothetical protein
MMSFMKSSIKFIPMQKSMSEMEEKVFKEHQENILNKQLLGIRQGFNIKSVFNSAFSDYYLNTYENWNQYYSIE